MKKHLRLAFDGASFMWHTLLAGKDEENGYKVLFDEKEVLINTAEYGYDICLPMMLKVMQQYRLTPIDVILVMEGKNSKSKRLMIDKAYKGGKDGGKPPEAYEEFGKLKEMLVTTFLGLGAQVLTQPFAEGDDTLAWLAQNTEDDLIVATFDNDLTALNQTNEHGALVTTWIDRLEGINKYGLFDFHLVTTYKALVGDTSDNIKGCPGFGVKTFEKFVAQYGYDGLQELHEMLLVSDLSPLEDMVGSDEHKIVTMIMNNAAQVMKSFDVARLRPEWVNTMSHPIEWQVGMVRRRLKTDDVRLKPWYGSVQLITADLFDDACEWALSKIAESREVALDIETSSCDEGDEWLQRKDKADGVDVFGAKLTSLQLTFGDNNQYTLYFPVDHADTDNVDSEKLRLFITKIPRHIPVVIQNVNFELPVLFNEWGARQMDNGYRGFLPNVLDTKLEANYVDENSRTGLKERSLKLLGYTQATYSETACLTGDPDTLPRGGRLLRENYLSQQVGTGKMEPTTEVDENGAYVMAETMKWVTVEYDTGEVERDDTGEPVLKKGRTIPIMAPVIESVTRQYRMNELPAKHCLRYGADDTICTIALHNYYKLFMQLEHTWKVYLQVEIDAAYANAAAFISGIPFSMERMLACEAEDKAEVEKAWPVLRQFLIDNGWAGTAAPVYTKAITVAEVKEAYQIVTGTPLDTMMRTMSKLVTYIGEVKGETTLAALLERMVDTSVTDEAMVRMYEKAFTAYVCKQFTGEPEFNIDSPTQMARLMYEILKLPVRIANKLTDVQRAAGKTTGNPKTDDLAVQNALHFDGNDSNREVLKAIQVLKQCGTRSKLYYGPYRAFPHWRDGLLHPSTNQCATVTRRNSASDPNYTQWPSKGEGLKFRECVVARGAGRVIISADSSGQELRLAADLSRDAAMLSCYIGDNKRDIHSLVAASATKYFLPREYTYEEFYAALKGEDEEIAEQFDALRSKSKTVNFGEIYGAQAQSLAHRLMITEEEAQTFLDAKKARFPGVDVWKDKVVQRARKIGYSQTMLGARRHLRDVLVNGDKWEISKAERQLSNAEIQSSGAEAVKIAWGRMYRDEIVERCDVHLIGTVHDESVLDCPAEHAHEVATKLEMYMSAQYANMIVPFESEVTLGVDFGKQLKLPKDFTREDVEARLLKLFPQKIVLAE
jgi:DNA polymerase I-like protein with 3'-5' exonuclease and polymerase domains/5'-3' exonuclease